MFVPPPMFLKHDYHLCFTVTYAQPTNVDEQSSNQKWVCQALRSHDYAAHKAIAPKLPSIAQAV